MTHRITLRTTVNSKGVTGWAYKYLGSGALAWKSSTQGLVSHSSTESELYAIDGAYRELRLQHRLLEDFALPHTLPTILGQDNLSTTTLIEGTHYNSRTRHLALRYHYCGSLQRAGILRVDYLPTAQMTADVLTKGLSRDSHERHSRVLLGHDPIQWEKKEKSAP